MLTDADIAGYMGWRGPGAYTAAAMRKIKRVIVEAESMERSRLLDKVLRAQIRCGTEQSGGMTVGKFDMAMLKDLKL